MAAAERPRRRGWWENGIRTAWWRAPIEFGDGQGTTVTLAVPVPGEAADPGDARDGRERAPDRAPVDDHAVVRAGIRMLLESRADVTVVTEASSAEDAIAVVLDHDPDVIVTDLSMEGIRGASVVEAFVDRFPSARILVLSMVDSPADVRRALEAGAKGYMLKGAAAAELSDAISRILSGESYVQPALGVLLAGHGARAATYADPARGAHGA